MLRFVIEPGARDYYAQQGISFGFHQLLRVLDDPVSMIDPTGFLSERDTIVGHVMQVVHLNPIYDLQLLQMFADGLDELERQVEAMVAGTHPRQRTIGAIVEDPDYHARLLDYVRALPRGSRHAAAGARADAARRSRTSPRPSAPSRRCPASSPTPPRSPSGALWRRPRSDRFPIELAAR